VVRREADALEHEIEGRSSPRYRRAEIFAEHAKVIRLTPPMKSTATMSEA